MASQLRNPRKNLSRFIELDYFKRRTLFRWWWRSLLLVAALVGLVCLGGMFAATGERTFQAGPMSDPHALFANDCGKCHQGNFNAFTRLWKGDSVGSVPDSACIACHAGSHHNPPHAKMGRCVECHKEHRGHPALIRVADQKCTDCHRDLKREDGGEPAYDPHITSFREGKHPQFSYWSGGTKKDPGTLRFNHAVHLKDSGVMVLDQEQMKKTFAELRKKGSDPGKFIPSKSIQKLECADCHKTDASGKYMQPISYEAHCQKCHPLSTQLAGTWKDPDLTALAHDFSSRSLRHPKKGESPATVRVALLDELTKFIKWPASKGFLKGDQDEPVRPLPGKHPLKEPMDAKLGLTEKEYTWVNKYLNSTASILYEGAGGCKYCHTVKEMPKGKPGTGEPPVLLKPDIKDRWWDHANFKHDTHRMMACTDCHDAKQSKETSDVLLPGIDLCMKCHNAAKRSGMARSDCVECHGFHDPKLQKAAREKGTATIDWLRK